MEAIGYLKQARNLAELIGNPLTLHTIYAHLAGAIAHLVECGAKQDTTRAETLLAPQ